MKAQRQNGGSLGDGECADLGGVRVVLAIKRRVHGEFAAEDQLSLPPVACRHKLARSWLAVLTNC